MWLVPGAAWKIIFPAVFCLAKAAMVPGATAKTMGEMTSALPDTINGDTRIAQALHCMNGINSGENGFTVIAVITAPKNSTVTTAQDNTTDFLRIPTPIIIFGDTTTTDRYSTTVREPGGTIARGDPTTSYKTAPTVSSTAFEEVTKNFLQNVISTPTLSTTVENPYAIYTTTLGPGGSTAPNGDPDADTENATGFLEELSVTQDDVLPSENPGSTTLLSTENATNTITRKAITRGPHKAIDMATTFGNAPEDLPDNTQGNPECSSECEVIPPWGTVLLCLGTAFFIFALVGLLFLLPYCTKFRRTTAMSSSPSPRCSV